MKTLITILLLTVSTFAVDIYAPHLTTSENGKVDISTYIENAVGVISYQYNIIYDPDVITPSGDRDNNFDCSTGDLISGTTVHCNVAPEGTLRVVVVGVYGFSGKGEGVSTPFVTHEGSTILGLDAVYFFNQNGAVASSAYDGEVILTP